LLSSHEGEGEGEARRVDKPRIRTLSIWHSASHLYIRTAALDGRPAKEKRRASKKKDGKSLKKAKALAHTKPLKAAGGDVLKLKPW